MKVKLFLAFIIFQLVSCQNKPKDHFNDFKNVQESIAVEGDSAKRVGSKVNDTIETVNTPSTDKLKTSSSKPKPVIKSRIIKLISVIIVVLIIILFIVLVKLFYKDMVLSRFKIIRIDVPSNTEPEILKENLIEDKLDKSISISEDQTAIIKSLTIEITELKAKISVLETALDRHQSIFSDSSTKNDNIIEFNLEQSTPVKIFYHHDIEEDQESLKVSKATDQQTARSIYEIREIGYDASLCLLESSSITKQLIDYSRWQLEPFFELPSELKKGITLIKSKIPAKFKREGEYWILTKKGTVELI